MKRYVHCSIIHNSQGMEATQESTKGGVGKEHAVPVLHHSALRKEILPFPTIWWTLTALC